MNDEVKSYLDQYLSEHPDKMVRDNLLTRLQENGKSFQSLVEKLNY